MVQINKIKLVFAYILPVIFAQDSWSPIDIVSQALNGVVATTNGTEAIQAVETYFSTEYKQYTDTTVLDYEGFKQHVQELTNGLTHVEFNIYKIIGPSTPVNSSDTTIYQVGTYHHVEDTVGSKTAVANVIAVFSVQNGQIIECHEVTETE